MEGVPVNEEHIKDRNNCFGPVLHGIWEAKGARVRGLGNSLHRGHRGDGLVDHETERRGGYHPKLPPQEEKPFHPQAARAVEVQRKERIERHARYTQQRVENDSAGSAAV